MVSKAKAIAKAKEVLSKVKAQQAYNRLYGSQFGTKQSTPSTPSTPEKEITPIVKETPVTLNPNQRVIVTFETQSGKKMTEVVNAGDLNSIQEREKNRSQMMGTPERRIIKLVNTDTGKPFYQAEPSLLFRMRSRVHNIMEYKKTKEVPSWATEQIPVPESLVGIGASKEYKQRSYEKYLGFDTSKMRESQIETKMKKSESFMSTQPIFEGGKTFGELHYEQPALYMTKTEKGFYEPKLDIVRWQNEETVYNLEANKNDPFSTLKKNAVETSNFILNLGNPDWWFAEDRTKFVAEQHYQSYQNKREGAWGVLKTWVGMQSPAYLNIILPLAGGHVIGRLGTAVKLAGGIGRVSKRVAFSYGALVVGGTAMGGKAVYDIGSEVGEGKWREVAKDVTSLGSAILLGGIGYRSGAKLTHKIWKTKNPNIEWISQSVPVKGEKYYSSMQDVLRINRSNKSPINLKKFDMIKISQRFKPKGKTSVIDIYFPKNAPKNYGKSLVFKLGKHGKIGKKYGVKTQRVQTNPFLSINFPKSGSPTRPQFDLNLLYSKDSIKSMLVGYGEGTTRTFKSRWGKRYGYGYKTVFGNEELSYDVSTLAKKTSGNIEFNTIRSNFKIKDIVQMKRRQEMRKIAKEFGANKATQPIAPFSILERKPRLVIPDIITEFKAPKLEFNTELGFYPPIMANPTKYRKQHDLYFKSEIDSKRMMSSILGITMLQAFKSEFGLPSISMQDVSYKLGYGTIQKQQYKFDTNYQQKLGLDTVVIPEFKTNLDYNYKAPYMSFPTLPIKMGGGGAYSTLEEQLGLRYRFRKFNIPSLEKLL